MESAHAEAACLLIEAGADRTRVGLLMISHPMISELNPELRKTWTEKLLKALRVSAARNRSEPGHT